MPKKKAPSELRKCPGCEVSFWSKRKNQVYHSTACGTAHWERLNRKPVTAAKKAAKRNQERNAKRTDNERARLMRAIHRGESTESLRTKVEMLKGNY
jgi:hypothetical protein